MQLIQGTSGTGKTTYILNKIKEFAEDGKNCILIVPEQFSKTAEGLVSSLLLENGLNLVNVYSFTSLIKHAKDEGKISLPSLLTKAGKAVLISSAMQSSIVLNSYQKQRKNISFSYNLSELFDEFKRSGITSADLFSISENKNEKLKEISLIYAEYSNLLNDDLSDEEEILSLFSKNIPVEYIENSYIFIDNFESFSYGQLEIITRFFEKAKDVFISLPLDDLFENENSSDYFAFSRKTANKLISSAKKVGAKVNAPIKMQTAYRFLNSNIKLLDDYLKLNEINEIKEDIFITEFETQYNEVCYVCAKIHELVKNGYSYNDIAIISPQIEKYENQLEESLLLSKIPYFIDQNRIISNSSPVLIFKAVLDLLIQGVNSDTLMNLLKTNLTFYNTDTINLLENYLFIWQDFNLDFLSDFTLPISGIETRKNEKDAGILKEINELKQDIINKISLVYDENKEYTAKEILMITYNLVLDFGCENSIIKIIFDENSNKTASDLLKNQWEEVISVLNEFNNIIGDKILSPEQILDLFSLMIEGAKIGFSPQTQDCIMISEPARIKTDEVKAVFILGAAQDVFPRSINNANIISLKDKEFIKSFGYDLKSDFDNLYEFGMLYFYKALTTAKEKLFISCAKNNIGTSEMLSSDITHIKTALNIQSDILQNEDYAITKEFFKDYILQNSNDFEKNSIINSLNSLNIPLLTLKEKQFNIKDIDYLNEYIGAVLKLSPTAVENYFKCPFMYFLNNIYRLYPIEKANFSQKHAGDYLHYIAYKILEKYKGEYHKADFENIKTDAKEIILEYINNTYPTEIINTSQFSSQRESMQNNVFQLLNFIYIEQQNSLFRPIGFEERFSENTDLKPLCVMDNNKTAIVSGVLDRVDLYQKDNVNYLRVIDYKTGTKNFSLDDIYNGLSSQLLLYMNALIDNNYQNLDNLNAAAVVYQPSDVSFKFDKDNESLYIPVGMAVSDIEISKAFDTSSKGTYGVIKGNDTIANVPGSSVVSGDEFKNILSHTKENIKTLTNNVYSGDFSAIPIELTKDVKPCDYCSYISICQNKTLSKPKVKNNFTQKKGDVENG